MKKVIILFLALLIANICIGQDLYEGKYEIKPNRDVWAGAGFVTGELVYQGMYCLTKDNDLAIAFSLPTSILIGIGTAQAEKAIKGYDEISPCHLAMLVAGQFINLGLHHYLEGEGKNYTVYQWKQNKKLNKYKLKKQARLYRKQFENNPSLAFK